MGRENQLVEWEMILQLRTLFRKDPRQGTCLVPLVQVTNRLRLDRQLWIKWTFFMSR
uniref:Uncharacterized protein n=1 Tax=Rhizophora mucronata TaxID=61149 RepID=A0A2P2PIM0_RHIMU